MDPAQILEQLNEQTSLREEELSQLPRWALVALSSRAAQRALPLFHKDWPDPPTEFLDAINSALSLSDESARQGATVEGLQQAATEAGNAATSAANLTARFASFTVAFAAVNAANVALAENTENAVAFVMATADACHKSATFAGARFSAFKSEQFGSVAGAFARAMRRDFTELLNVARRDDWTSETPVETESLGELWPEGAPLGY